MEAAMTHDELAHQGLIRDIGRRLQLTSHGEACMVDRGLAAIERIRCGGDRRWERRIPTGTGDHDTSFHLATPRARAGVVATLCNGSWPLGDAVETTANVPLEERCRACWRAAVGDDRLALQLLELADELAAEDQERAELREAARAEMLGAGGQP
jgi:hypothetical protein